jgi:hypothetical protein
VLRSRWEQRRLGKAASLLRDRNFVKGPGAKSPARDEHTSSRFFIRASIYQWCENPLPPGSAVPLPMSLSSRWQGSEVQINLNRIRRKTAKIHSRLVLDRGRFGCGYLQSLKSKTGCTSYSSFTAPNVCRISSACACQKASSAMFVA